MFFTNVQKSNEGEDSSVAESPDLFKLIHTSLPLLSSRNMSIWIFKAILQKVISFLPFSQQINFFFQKYITKGVILSDEYFEDRLLHCREHFKNFRKYNSTVYFSCLEIGTGWYPVVPLGYFLYGAKSITTVDLVRLSNGKLIGETFSKFLEYHKKGKLEILLPGILNERLLILLEEAENPTRDFYAVLDKHLITYMVMDARKLHLPNNSVDLITSNNTFEHVDCNALEGILIVFKKMLKVGGVMSHAIDLSDHFAHMDKSITIYNFLKFSQSQWSLIDNSIQPQNRMRIYDYRNVYKKLSIPINEEISREFILDDYRKVKVDEAFLLHSEQENAVSHSTLISVGLE